MSEMKEQGDVSRTQVGRAIYQPKGEGGKFM